MEENKLQNQINEINLKLDKILEEIEYLQRKRREMEDLKDDLLRVGKDLYQTTVKELDEVHDYISTGEILFLGKKVLRNISTLTKTLEQLESARDFLQDAAPLARESFIDLMNKLDEFDRKGYFTFAKELGKVTDRVVTSFSPEDVKKFGENIVTIINTIKNLTQPEILQTANNALAVYKNINIDVNEKISLIRLLKEINTPEVKRGLYYAIQFLKNMSNQQKEDNNANKTNSR